MALTYTGLLYAAAVERPTPFPGAYGRALQIHTTGCFISKIV